MTLLEQALGAYLTAALPALVIDPKGGHLSILGELVESEIVDDVQPWDPDDVVDAEVVEGPSPAGDQSDHALLERLAACEEAIAALHAEQVEVLAEFGRRRAAQFADEEDAPLTARRHRKDFAADELTARLRWTAWTAQHRLDEAERLSSCLPRTWTALASGRLDYPRVRRIVNATRSLSEDDAAAVDEVVADRAEGLTTAQLDALLAAEVVAVDAAAAERRAAAAAAARRVVVEPRPDGQAVLVAEGPAVDILAIMRGLTKAAGDRTPGDERGVDARRFDALRGWACSALEDADAVRGGRSGGGGAWRPHVLITVALSTVLGLDDDPGHLHGYGPVPAHVARQAAADGTLKRLLTDPVTGLVVGVDGHTYPGGLRVGGRDERDEPGDEDGPDDPPPRDPGPGGGGGPAPEPAPEPAPAPPCPVAAAGGGRYRPGRSMARFVQYRDLTCTAPGCRRRAEVCDLDHIVRHPIGPTCPCNMHPLCRRHHRMKHLSGATVVRLATGETVWTMPTGHVVTRPPTPPLHRPLVRRRSGRGDAAVGDAAVGDGMGAAYQGRDLAAGGLDALRAAVDGAQRAVAEPGTTTQSWADGKPPF